MCAGGRIVDYLKALIEDSKNHILFVGYQATGTTDHDILKYRCKPNGYVTIDGERYHINANVQQISGYSAHAGQKDLLNFIKRMRVKPQRVHIVHGDQAAKAALQEKIEQECRGTEAIIGKA